MPRRETGHTVRLILEPEIVQHLIPLIGRQAELAALLLAVRDPACGMAVLRGPAGAGKTALADAALERIREDGGLVGAGAYAEGWDRAPFGPIMRALSQAVGQALDGLYDPEAGMQAMQRALGPAGEVLRQTGFFASTDFGPEAAPAPIGRREGAARIVDASLKLITWLAGFEKPIVLFIDDWWRGAPEVRAALVALAAAAPAANLTLLATERGRTSPDPGPDGGGSAVIEVGPLPPGDRSALLEEVLGEAGHAASEWFGAGGPTLPFDIRAAATALRNGGALVRGDAGWSVDPARAAEIDQKDLAQTLVDRLADVSGRTGDLALAIALWGEPAPLDALASALALRRAELDRMLEALQTDGVVRFGTETASLMHDRLRAPLLKVKGGAVHAFALAASERLRSASDAVWHSADAAALNLRRLAGIESIAPERWRDRFALGALQARRRSDLDSAGAFAEVAWRLREQSGPLDPEADRDILREAILAAADRCESETVLARIESLLALQPHGAPRGEDYEVAIAALRFSRAHLVGWSIGRQGLERLGLRLPEVARPRDLVAAAIRWRLDRWLGRLGRPPDPSRAEAAVRIGNAAGTLAFEFDPPMAALVAFQGSRNALSGVDRPSFWLAIDTFLLASLGDYRAAVRAGRTAAAALAREGEGAYGYAASLYRALFWGLIWGEPQGTLREANLRIRDLAVAEGDIVQAGVAIRNWVMLGWRSSPSLETLEHEIDEALRDIDRLGARDVASAVNAFRRGVRHLRSAPGSPAEGRIPDGWEPTSPAERLLALELASVEGEFARGQRMAVLNQAETRAFHSHPGIVVWRFHECLCNLKMGDPAPPRSIALVRRAAALNPTDHRAKLLVLEAEILRRRGGPRASLAAFAEAVALATRSPSRLEAGVAADCAADAARAAGEENLARDYQDRAQAIWKAWGARAKLLPGRESTDPAASDPLAARLAQAQGQLGDAERVARARSRLLADVAHELRTPMQGMQALIDLASGDAEAVDLPSLGRAFASLKTVVDDLTDYGALASGETPLTLGAVEIGELVRSEAKVAEAGAPGLGRLDIEIASGVPPFISTDAARVRQVVRNLLSNAGKYGGGWVGVQVGVLASETGEPATLEIVVEDNGPGLSPAKLIHLFEPFERGARAGDGTGLGLGLAVSRRIAERLGGALSGANRVEGGARFTFALPCRPADPPAAPVAARPARILLVEDEPLIRRLVAQILRRDGHEVFEAGEGRQALAQRAAHPVDLAIVDLGLPGMGGAKLLAVITSDPAGPTPAIAFTASGADAGQAARAAGAALVLRKPVSAAELRQAIATVLPDRARVSPGYGQAEADEMAGLIAAARVELVRRIPALIAGVTEGQASLASEAHQIAGLAAQFGWPTIAAAADAAELSLRAGRAQASAATALASALAALTDQTGDAATASR